jgi:hypothetical protein
MFRDWDAERNVAAVVWGAESQYYTVPALRGKL